MMNKRGFMTVVLLALFALSASARAEGTLDKIRSDGAITLGVRDSSGALSYTLGNGQYAGYHVELCQRIVDDLTGQIGKTLEVKYQSVTSQNRIPLVKNGTVDLVCGSSTNNESRARDVAFAHTTFVEEVRIAVRADSGIGALKDLAGKTVVTTTGTTSVKYLRKDKRAQGIDFKEIMGKDHADSFLLLESSRADAFVMDSSLLAGLIANSKDPNAYKIVGPALSIEPIALMLRKDDPDFKHAVNATLDRLMQSGEIASIYDKWFMQPIPPKDVILDMPVSDNLKQTWSRPNDDPAEVWNR